MNDSNDEDVMARNIDISMNNNMSNGPMFKDFGGISKVIEILKTEVVMPLLNHPYDIEGVKKPMTGILIHGPPGCGKTMLAHAIANESRVPLYKISAFDLAAGENIITDMFSKARRTAPSIVFIDEIDTISSIKLLTTCMDELHKQTGSDKSCGHVLVIGATNRIEDVHRSFSRSGRLSRQISLGFPDQTARVEILSVLTSKLKVDEGVLNLVKIARSTSTFVGADLSALVEMAGNVALNRILDKRMVDHLSSSDREEEWWRQPLSNAEIKELCVRMSDFKEAAKMVGPSSRGSEWLIYVPTVHWDDVGGLVFLKQEFDRCIVRRIKKKFPEESDHEGHLGKVFLLYGPPGCGKTLIANVVATEAGANFMQINGVELLLKKYDAEVAVQAIFSRARTCSPCLIFFNDVDLLTTKSGLVNQLLIELDGVKERQGDVYVIGSTSKPWLMDRAFMVSFGKLIYVPLPSPDERVMILKALIRNKQSHNIDLSNVDLMAIVKDSENLSGAELSYVMYEAMVIAFIERPKSSSCSIVKDEHFKKALGRESPSVSEKQIQYYNVLSESLEATNVIFQDLPRKLQSCSRLRRVVERGDGLTFRGR